VIEPPVSVAERLRRLYRGRSAERQAESWLAGQGLKTLSRNWRAGRGEIDLIMRDGDTLVFVEVRSRGSGARVRAVESLNERKLNKLRETASRYLQQHPRWLERPCRFDVITLDGPRESARIEWLRDAFQ